MRSAGVGVPLEFDVSDKLTDALGQTLAVKDALTLRLLLALDVTEAPSEIEFSGENDGAVTDAGAVGDMVRDCDPEVEKDGRAVATVALIVCDGVPLLQALSGGEAESEEKGDCTTDMTDEAEGGGDLLSVLIGVSDDVCDGVLLTDRAADCPTDAKPVADGILGDNNGVLLAEPLLAADCPPDAKPVAEGISDTDVSLVPSTDSSGEAVTTCDREAEEVKTESHGEPVGYGLRTVRVADRQAVGDNERVRPDDALRVKALLTLLVGSCK